MNPPPAPFPSSSSSSSSKGKRSSKGRGGGGAVDLSPQTRTRFGATEKATPPPQQPSTMPRPHFRDEPKTFSTKKERLNPHSSAPPPRPPAKSCPPMSRVFKRCPDFMSPSAQAVSFLQSADGSLTGTPLQSDEVYDNKKNVSFFEQTFDVEGKIGAGYFGTVYRARHKKDGELYAIKIAKERYRGSSDRTRKLEEVRKHEVLLPHPNCVHFYQSWEENGRLYQQFELCQMSLAELSESKHDLPEDVVWAYIVDLLQALQHLHTHNLIHMDVKPENIFIGLDGICKLGDFGLVIDLAKDSQGGVAGDSKYMANELLHHKYSKAADIFSLGVTILELACDLDLPSGGDLWHQLRQTGPDPRTTTQLSPDLKRVIQLMMGNDYDRRPTAKQLLELPAVEKAKKRRARQLAIQSVVGVIKTMFLPVFTLLILLYNFLIRKPGKLMQEKFDKSFGKPENFSTPPQPAKLCGINGTHGGSSFSSDEDDLDHSHSSSTHSILASPLANDSSPTSGSFRLSHQPGWPSPIRSAHNSRGSRRLDGQQVQSTPSGMRYRSRAKARTPGVSPNKRLNFEELLQSPNLENSIHAHSTFQEDDDSDSSTKIKPVSLASKFDYFSDDNSDKD